LSFEIHAPKVVATNDGRYVVMWEEFHNIVKNTYFTVLSSYGEVLHPKTILKNTRLSHSVLLIFRNGKIYWTVAIEGDYKTKSRIELYSLEVPKG
jgi:hypothetical protein